MIRRGTVARARLAVCAGAALAAALCGCAIIGEQYVLERQFTESQAQAIRKGETKKEVLDRLGPPGAVARPGTSSQLSAGVGCPTRPTSYASMSSRERFTSLAMPSISASIESNRSCPRR